ncbi:MAG: DUF5320 domain-containing protein [bacterium]
MYRYGYEWPDYYGWGMGRHLRLHRHCYDWWRPWGYGLGYGFRHGGIYDYGVVPSRTYLQETLEWLKDEKAQIEKEISDIEALLKGEQAK